MTVSLFRVTAVSAALLAGTRVHAQIRAADGPVVRAATLEPTAEFDIRVPSGSVQLIGWGRDSIVVQIRNPDRTDFYFGAERRGGKMGFQHGKTGVVAAPANVVIHFPRRGTVAVRTVDADVSASDIGGTYNTVSGTIRISGETPSIDVEAMSGNIDLDVTTPWARARTGQGHLLIRGAPQDIDASTVGGSLDIAAPAILRGRFSSVTGDIRYATDPAPSSLFEFSNHGGGVDFLLPRDVSGRFEISTVTGEIQNGFTQARPIAAGPHNLRLSLGRGDAQFTVRTFKGTVRLRPK